MKERSNVSFEFDNLNRNRRRRISKYIFEASRLHIRDKIDCPRCLRIDQSTNQFVFKTLLFDNFQMKDRMMRLVFLCACIKKYVLLI